MIFEAAQDFHDAAAAMPREHPKHRMLELLEEAIRRDIHFIARHPTTLFQCMWNTCWWYDCPEAVEHYAESEGDCRATPWENAGVKLHEALIRWRGEKEEATPEFLWIRSLRPPPNRLGGRLRVVLPHDREVSGVAISSDGRWIASASADYVCLWDTIKCIPVYWLEGRSSVAFSPDGKRIVSDSKDGAFRVWDLATGQQDLRFGACRGSRASFSLDGQCIVSCSPPLVYVWDAVTGQQVTEIRCEEGEWALPVSASFSPDGTRIVIATASSLPGLHVSDANSGQTVLALDGHGDKVYDAAFSPDGSRIVSCSRDETVRLWDAHSGEQIHCFREHKSRIYSVAFSPDGQRVVSASWDNTVRVFDAEDEESSLILRGHVNRANRAIFNADGSMVVSASDDGTVRVWDVSSAPHVRYLRGHHRQSIARVLFSSDGARLFSRSAKLNVTGDGEIEHCANCWDPERGTPVLLGDESPVIDAVLQWFISKAAKQERTEEESFAKLGVRPDDLEQLRRSSERWTATCSGDVIAFCDTNKLSLACVFPAHVTTMRAQPGGCLWAGGERVRSNYPYGGFDDWRGRYLYILQMEGRTRDLAMGPESQGVVAEDVQPWPTIERVTCVNQLPLPR